MKRRKAGYLNAQYPARLLSADVFLHASSDNDRARCCNWFCRHGSNHRQCTRSKQITVDHRHAAYRLIGTGTLSGYAFT